MSSIIKEKKYSIEAESKRTQMLELAHEVLKIAIVNIFKDTQKEMDILNKQMGSISKEIDSSMGN